MVAPGEIAGDPSKLDDLAKETVDLVVESYGGKEAGYLSELSHHEPPWLEAREGLQPGERGSSEISHAAMAEYYGSLL